jgi:hypothetical protein
MVFSGLGYGIFPCHEVGCPEFVAGRILKNSLKMLDFVTDISRADHFGETALQERLSVIANPIFLLKQDPSYSKILAFFPHEVIASFHHVADKPTGNVGLLQPLGYVEVLHQDDFGCQLVAATAPCGLAESGP